MQCDFRHVNFLKQTCTVSEYIYRLVSVFIKVIIFCYDLINFESKYQCDNQASSVAFCADNFIFIFIHQKARSNNDMTKQYRASRGFSATTGLLLSLAFTYKTRKCRSSWSRMLFIQNCQQC